MSQKGLDRCPVCFSRFSDGDYTPKIFPTCGHTICKKCLHQVLMNYTSKCPLDKLPFGQDFRSVDSFPTNLLAQSLIEKNNKWSRCEAHPQEFEKLICMTNRELICTDCVVFGDYKDHEVKSLVEVQNCAKIKEDQLKEILNKITTNMSQVDAFIEEKVKAIRATTKEKFKSLYEAIKKHEAEMLQKLESVLRKQIPRVQNPRLRGKVPDMKHNLWRFSVMMSLPSVLEILEEDFTELEQTVKDELIFTSQKMEEFESLFAVFENSLPTEDLLKERIADVLDQNLAEWNKTRKFAGEEANEVLISSEIRLNFHTERLLEVLKSNNYMKPKEDLAYDKSKLGQVQRVEYSISLDDLAGKETIMPDLLNLSKALPNAKWVIFNFGIFNGSRVDHSNGRFYNLLSATLSQPENIDRLEFYFANYAIGDLEFLFLAEKVLPKIKDLKSFSIVVRETQVSSQALKALTQVNWKAWPNLEHFRVTLPEPSFKESEIHQFLDAVPNVKKLSLGFGNTQLTDELLETFSTKILPPLDKLERLEVGFWNTKLTSVGIEKFLMDLPNIKRLLIGLGRTGITEDVIKLFLEKKLPSLTKLKELELGISRDSFSKEFFHQIQDREIEIFRKGKKGEKEDDWKFRTPHKTLQDPDPEAVAKFMRGE